MEERKSEGLPEGEHTRVDVDIAEETVSVSTLDRPPTPDKATPAAKVFRPWSPHVIALIIPASCLGLLARLGLLALGSYSNQAIFPLAYPQALGCFVMGYCLHNKERIGRLSVCHLPSYSVPWLLK
jgi:fluoride exporter